MNDGMPLLIFRDGFVQGETQTLMSVLAPPAGISRRTIIGVSDMASRSTACSIVACMIIRPKKSEKRIVQPRFLQAEKHRVGAIERPESALG